MINSKNFGEFLKEYIFLFFLSWRNCSAKTRAPICPFMNPFDASANQDKPTRLKMKGTRKKALNPTVQ